MKKLLIILLAAGLLFVGVAGCAQRTAPVPSPAPVDDETIYVSPVNPEPPTTAVPEAQAAAPVKHVDLEALHALYPEDAVYATIGEREIAWGEYYEWLGSYILNGENYMESMAAYGMSGGWDSPYAEGVTLGDSFVANLNDNLRAFTGIDMFAAQNGISVSAEELEAKKAEDRNAMLGADATDEAWGELLTANFLTENLYRAQARANIQLQKLMEAKYGKNGELLSTAALQHYIEDKEYLRCNHILFLTMDMETREPLDEETIAKSIRPSAETQVNLELLFNAVTQGKI